MGDLARLASAPYRRLAIATLVLGSALILGSIVAVRGLLPEATDQAPAPLHAPASVGAPPFPRLATIYSKGRGQNTQPTQAAIAQFNLYVADMINWPTASAADPSITQGQYYKRQNPALLALMYFHSCLYSDIEYEYAPGQFTIGDRQYYIDPRWYLTYAGSSLARDISAAATHLPVVDLAPFAVGERVKLGGGPGQSRVELAIVVDKSAREGPGELTVTRGALAQGGRFAATDHARGDYVRPVAHAFGSGEWMLLNPTATAEASDVNAEFGTQTWSQFVAAFLARKMSDPNFANIDGYMLDNFVDRPTALVDQPRRVDLYNTNTPTGLDDASWSVGMQDLARRVRAQLPPDQILMANDGGRQAHSFGPYLNGGMLEGIDQDGATEMHGNVKASLGFYSDWMALGSRPPIFIFDGSPRVGGIELGAIQYQALRFLLTLALTNDGYFVFDDFNINASHETLWWYDEYDDAGRRQPGYLGHPLGPVFEPVPGVYRREFDRGISISNTTSTLQHIDLGGTFRKIAGRQAPLINDGSEVTRVSLAAKDGIILLRP